MHSIIHAYSWRTLCKHVWVNLSLFVAKYLQMDTNTNKCPNRRVYRKGQTWVITGLAIIQWDTASKMSLGAGGLQSGLQVTKWKQNWLFACTHTTVPVYPRIWRPLFCSHTHFKNVVLYKFCDLTSGPVWINPGLDSIYKTEEMRSSYFLCCFSWYMNVIILAGCLHSQQSAT